MSEFQKSNRSDHADSIIKNHMIWSMGAGFIPVPIADLFAVSAIQLDMIRQMCKLYEVDFQQTQGKALITALTGSGLARLGARAVKFIPGVGSILGGVTMAVLSGASTFALGEVFKKHFETGGTFLDFDPQRLKNYYNEKFEKGKQVAEDMRKKQENVSKSAEASSAVDKLKELVDMKSAGILTEEEFETMKKKIIQG
ncbi:MAG: DUF697 domain-containing protein [Saprospiraceae bacterium]|jgi:uncharacterized protein (DUF697 family)|nr:DUF697 domain-containing protein [Saprospiraceae bacterium]MBP6448255.1 DUF697 domain-containing protein [Saprospiraceae bacterium]